MIFQAKGMTCVNVLGRKTQRVFEELKEIRCGWSLLEKEGKGMRDEVPKDGSS